MDGRKEGKEYMGQRYGGGLEIYGGRKDGWMEEKMEGSKSTSGKEVRKGNNKQEVERNANFCLP